MDREICWLMLAARYRRRDSGCGVPWVVGCLIAGYWIKATICFSKLDQVVNSRSVMLRFGVTWYA